MMTHCGTTDSCMCLSEAYHDALFNHWAIAHGLGFDFCKAVQDSGWDYWTAQGDTFTFDLALTYMDGRPMPFVACCDSLARRDRLAERVVRYYGAYLLAVPPESAKGKAVVCGCGVTPVFEEDEWEL